MRYRCTHSHGRNKAQRPFGTLRQSFIVQNDPMATYRNRSDTVCFTGHRHIAAAKQPELIRRLDGMLDALYRRGYRYFISGGAIGFDILAAERVLAMQKQHPEMRLILALPCSDQSSLWNERDCRRYERMLYFSDETHVLSPAYYEGCMLTRNRFMVDHAALCLCYMERMKGGTLSTVAYALNANVPVINLAMEKQCAAFMQDSLTD